jgi:hypothetical protein
LQIDARRLDADSLASLAGRIRDAATSLQALRGT